MIPKEKAKELVESFTFNCRECDNAKQCALICVDEILNAVTTIADKKYEYWQEVKKEIELL
jgi:hypothetical protein